MMRSICFLSILVAASGELTNAEKGQCLVDSGEAVSDAMDAALFIWAAAKRCGKTNMELKCAIDITAAVKSVNSIVNVLLHTLDKCDALHGAHKACGMQASKLTEQTAGLGQAAEMVAQKCEKNAVVAPSTGTAAVMCTLSLKNTGKHLFKTISALQKASSACSGGDHEKCSANILEIVASFAAVGEYVAATVGQCQRATGALASRTKEELCAGAAQGLVHHTAKAAEAGINLKGACSGPKITVGIEQAQTTVGIEQEARLYEQDGVKVAGVPVANVVLGAFLPVTAIVGFIGGRVYATRRARTEQTREFMSDNE
jgi:hypothetical protein